MAFISNVLQSSCVILLAAFDAVSTVSALLSKTLLCIMVIGISLEMGNGVFVELIYPIDRSKTTSIKNHRSEILCVL